MQHERERAVLHGAASPQAHLDAVARGVAYRRVLAFQHVVHVLFAVVVHHFRVVMDAARGDDHALLRLEQKDLAVLVGGEHAGDLVAFLQQLRRRGLEQVGGGLFVLGGVLRVHVQHVRRLEVAALGRPLRRGVGLVELAVRERFGDDGLRRVGAERVGLHAVFGRLVDEPVARLARLVEPQGHQRLVHAAAAAAHPQVLGLGDVHHEVLADGFAVGLRELRVAQADAAAASLHGFQLFQDDGLQAVVDARCRRRAARVAGAQDDDVGFLHLGRVAFGKRRRRREERRVLDAAVAHGRGALPAAEADGFGLVGRTVACRRISGARARRCAAGKPRSTGSQGGRGAQAQERTARKRAFL